MLSKLIACGAAALWAKLSAKESLMVGIGMAPRGEVALIVASLGLTTGILSTAQYSIISAMALLTTFAAPPLLGLLIKKKD
jgi:Kef-type K+ transport system membrane component KefB